MNLKIEDSWKERLNQEFKKPYFKNLVSFVEEEYNNDTIYPPHSLMFNAFNKCSFHDLKVVILGQDPYHGEGQVYIGLPQLYTAMRLQQFQALDADASRQTARRTID